VVESAFLNARARGGFTRLDSTAPGDRRASYEGQLQPPLAVNLFDVRDTFLSAVNAFPRARPLIGALRITVKEGQDVEAALERNAQRAEAGDPDVRLGEPEAARQREHCPSLVREAPTTLSAVASG